MLHRTMALGSTQPLMKMSTRNIPGGKGGQCVRLTTSPPSHAERHEIWEPKAPGTLWATPGLLRDSFTFFPGYCNDWRQYSPYQNIRVDSEQTAGIGGDTFNITAICLLFQKTENFYVIWKQIHSQYENISNDCEENNWTDLREFFANLH
jgi:hypothetical protein